MIYTCTVHPEWREDTYRGMLDHVHVLHPGDPADYLVQMGYLRLDSEGIEVAQLGELVDACRGEITGAFILVELPDGTVMRVTTVHFRGSVGGQDRSMVIGLDPTATVPHHSHRTYNGDCAYCTGEQPTCEQGHPIISEDGSCTGEHR